MIDISPNKTIFNKRVSEFPWKAQIDGSPLAVGATKTECQENAVIKLKAVYKAAQAPMVVVIANDGTVYAARWIDEAQIEYWIYRNGERGCGCIGTCSGSLQRYMDGVVSQYNQCTAAA